MVSRKEKLLQKAERNPAGLRFEELEYLLEKCGWVYDRTSGSHRVWIDPDGKSKSFQPLKDGKAKKYQVRQFLRYQNEQRN